jgi:Phytanoyl-CoA dioxygenase (PhyH)
MRELKVANDLPWDHPGFTRQFEEDGYLFFKNVLDRNVVEAVRTECLAALRQVGVVDPEAVDPIWNGTDISHVDAALKQLTTSQPWELLRTDPTLATWLRAIMGGDYNWLPLISCRVMPPLLASVSHRDVTTRFIRMHQDGYNNPGLAFVIFWLPLMLIDDDLGGIAIAEGFHKRVLPHNTSGPAMFGIPEGAIPDDVWASATFGSGDLIAMNALTPHTGMTNCSNRFRLSLDFRLAPASSQRVIAGTILAIAGDRISIGAEDGEWIELRIDDETVVPHRQGTALRNGGRIPRAELMHYLTVGQRILATEERGNARLIRDVDVGFRGYPKTFGTGVPS